MLTVYTLLMVLLLFGATIFVHELGHFLVARWCGMVVDVFSIGFGPAVWKRKVGEVTYKIGIFPFGGYVALPQMDPTGMDEASKSEAATRKLPRVAAWKRMLVSLSGVTGNVLFAIFLAYLVFWVGKPSAPHERNCIVGSIETNSAAYQGGLRLGDEIVSVNGQRVANWDEFIMAASLDTQAMLFVRSPGGESSITLPTEKSWLGVRSVAGIGWMNSCGVASVVPGSSAEAAGIRTGDELVEFNGQKLYSREHLIDLVNQARDATVPARIKRDGETLDIEVTPKYDAKAGRALIGIMFNTMDLDYDTIVHPRPSAQLKQQAMAMFRFLKALVTPGKAKAASQAVGGPVAILIMFWWTVQKSLILAVSFTGSINITLAIINLLPIPVVDGGHVVFCLWEMITRRPLSQKVFNIMMNVFTVLLIGVFLLITFRDLRRWVVPMFPRSQPAAVEAVTNEAPAESVPE